MRRVLLMVGKDLRRKVRAPLGVLIILSFPIVFSLMIAVTFGGAGSSIPKVKLLIEDQDGELLSRAVLSAFSAEQAAEYFEVEEVGEDGVARMEQGEASALLRIPENFTEDLIRGDPVTLELVRNPAQSILPEAAEQITLILAEILSAGSRVLREPLDEIAGMLDTEGESVTDASVADVSVSFRRLIDRGGEYLFPPAITLEAVDLEDPEEEEGDPSISGVSAVFLFILPGVSVYALFIIGDIAMRDILAEGQAGTLRRQLAGPFGAGSVVAAKAVLTAVLAAISLLILSVLGWIVSPRGVDLGGFIILSLALILAVTGAASLVYGLARNERQGSTVAAVVFLFLAFSSGNFIQRDSLPRVLQSISEYSPFYWANRGFGELLWGEAGVAGVLPEAGLLAAVGAALLFLGSRLLHRRVLRGATT